MLAARRRHSLNLNNHWTPDLALKARSALRTCPYAQFAESDDIVLFDGVFPIALQNNPTYSWYSSLIAASMPAVNADNWVGVIMNGGMI